MPSIGLLGCAQASWYSSSTDALQQQLQTLGRDRTVRGLTLQLCLIAVLRVAHSLGARLLAWQLLHLLLLHLLQTQQAAARSLLLHDGAHRAGFEVGISDVQLMVVPAG